MIFNMPDFAHYLKEWRIKANITQIEMANKLNMTQSHVSKYETGRKVIDLETFIRWVRVTNAEVNAATVMFGAELFTQAANIATLIPAFVAPAFQLF